jgi:uroporphyrinogen-III synthase
MTPPLRGKTIVVTRPLAQAGALAALIEAQGGRAIVFPLLEIGPAEDPAPLAAAIDELDAWALAVFISPNAVAYSVPAILARRPWPAGLRAVAVGGGTVAALAELGIGPTIVPKIRFDSEALLELPELQAAAVSGKRVAIFRGNGGRELLADTLRERGARVDCISCYQRAPPAAGAAQLKALWAGGRLDAITLSSSEALRNLVDLLDADGRAQLARTPLFVPHQRIADAARALGLARTKLTAPADAGIIAGLCAYNW